MAPMRFLKNYFIMAYYFMKYLLKLLLHEKLFRDIINIMIKPLKYALTFSNKIP